MKEKITFYTIGCKANQAETASLRNSFAQNGFHCVDNNSFADISVINTCTVTGKADSDTRKTVNRIIRKNPKARIACIGCQAQTQKERLAQLPNIRWIVGNEQKMNLIQLINLPAQSQKPLMIVPKIQKKSFTMSLTQMDSVHTRANLKIQDGCDFFCSFCEIPYARGRPRSRIYDDIIVEARTLAKNGYQEIVLTGINLGRYQYRGKTLLHVLDALEKLPKLKRIRISSIELTTASLELVKRMNNSRLCPYLHIPMQSASDKILRSMKRKYRVGEFADFVLKCASAVERICIGTDLMVGFPGEKEEDFLQTCRTIERLPIVNCHIFSYCPRHFAKSKNLSNAVSESLIKKRRRLLRQIALRKRHQILKKFLHATQEVLFEQKKGECWSGLTDNYIRVLVSSEKRLHNRIVPVKIKQIENQNLKGVLSCKSIK